MDILQLAGIIGSGRWGGAFTVADVRAYT